MVDGYGNSADEERALPRFGLQCARWTVIVAGFAIPVAAGVVLAGITFWFATWWPRLFGLSGNGYFLAAFLTSWTLFPYLWVFELGRFMERVEIRIDVLVEAIDVSIKKRFPPQSAG